jgi:hypothetical protein
MHTQSVDAEWPNLRAELPAGWREAAKSTRAVRRDIGPLSEPETLLRLVLGHVAGDKSFRGVVAHARETGLCDVSDVALFKRERQCSGWLEWIAHTMMSETLADLPDSPLRLRLMDATTASRPGSDRSDFRLHVQIELPGCRFTGAQMTDGRGGESLPRLAAGSGDLIVGDRIYATADGIARVVDWGAAVLVRTNATSLPMWTCDGVRLDLLEAARMNLKPGDQTEIAVQIRSSGGQIVDGRLCIQELPPEQARKAQDRVRRMKLARGKHPGHVAVESAKYIFIFTTASRQLMSTRQVLATYRLRWQIELAFKTLKTVLHFDDLPNRLPDTARTWLLAKLVCALLLQRLADRDTPFSPSATSA